MPPSRLHGTRFCAARAFERYVSCLFLCGKQSAYLCTQLFTLRKFAEETHCFKAGAACACLQGVNRTATTCSLLNIVIAGNTLAFFFKVEHLLGECPISHSSRPDRGAGLPAVGAHCSTTELSAIKKIAEKDSNL